MNENEKTWGLLTPGCFLACSTAVRNIIAPIYRKKEKKSNGWSENTESEMQAFNSHLVCTVMHGQASDLLLFECRTRRRKGAGGGSGEEGGGGEKRPFTGQLITTRASPLLGDYVALHSVSLLKLQDFVPFQYSELTCCSIWSKEGSHRELWDFSPLFPSLCLWSLGSLEEMKTSAVTFQRLLGTLVAQKEAPAITIIGVRIWRDIFS